MLKFSNSRGSWPRCPPLRRPWPQSNIFGKCFSDRSTRWCPTSRSVSQQVWIRHPTSLAVGFTTDFAETTISEQKCCIHSKNNQNVVFCNLSSKWTCKRNCWNQTECHTLDLEQQLNIMHFNASYILWCVSTVKCCKLNLGESDVRINQRKQLEVRS